MSSFLSLPPEIRMTVYDFLLQSSLTSNMRMLYVSDDTIRRESPPGSVCHGRTHKIHENYIPLTGAKTTWTERTNKAGRNIHRADVEDLLSLAGTCRLIRSELLALAWSHADISVNSPILYMDLHYILCDRLSSNACTFIRTLQLKFEQHAWEPREMRRIVSLLRTRLPQLKHLILTVVVRPPADKDQRHALMALQSLPRQITVRFHYVYTAFTLVELYRHGARWAMERTMDEYFEARRAELDPIRQARSDEQARRKQGDQVADILEATVQLRSLSML